MREKREPANFATTYFATVYISLTVRQVSPAVGDYNTMMGYYRKKDFDTYTFGISMDLSTKFDNRRFHTLEELNERDSYVAVMPINHVILRTVANTQSPYFKILKKKDKLVSLLTKVVNMDITPQIIPYLNEIHQASDNLVTVYVVFENMDQYTRCMLQENSSRHIKLAGTGNTLFTLQDALTLSLSRDRSKLPEKFREHTKQLDRVGYIDEKPLLDGIFNQHLNRLTEDSALHRYIWGLGELDFKHVLSEEESLNSLIRVSRECNMLENLSDDELRPIAGYMNGLAIEGNLKPYKDAQI